MGNFIPDRRAAWMMLVERLGMLADRCRQLEGQPGVPAAAGRCAAEVDRRPARQAAACLSHRFLGLALHATPPPEDALSLAVR
jgi:hypothetical protein